MPQAVYILWAILLVVAVLAIPVITVGLHLTWQAARSIERYFAEMRDAGAGIAENTQHIKALNDTLAVASDMLDTAGAVNDHAATIKDTLAERAAKLN